MKKRYIFFTILVLLFLSNLASVPYINLVELLGRVGPILILVYTLYVINEVEKTAEADEPLTKSEKLPVIITEIFNPIIAGAFYYYCWKSQFPIKARQANKYSWIIFGIEFLILICVGVTFFYLVSHHPWQSPEFSPVPHS